MADRVQNEEGPAVAAASPSEDVLNITSEAAMNTAPNAENVAENHESANPSAITAQAVLARWKIGTASSLMNEKLPDLPVVVPGLLTSGLTVIGGKPKVGKSWLVLAMALAVSQGNEFLGRVASDRGDVLYLALEDSKRRLQQRIGQLLDEGAPSDRFHYVADAACAQQALELVGAWLAVHPNARLVIVDTFQKTRGIRSGNRNVYEVEYEELSRWKALADKHGVALVLVHHLAKEDRQDAGDRLNGSSAMSGAPDAFWVLTKPEGSIDEASLFVAGRDIDNASLDLAFSRDTGRWAIAAGKKWSGLPPEKREVVELIETRGVPMSTKEIADALGVSKQVRNRLDKRLGRMVDSGLIRRVRPGVYALPSSCQSECQNAATSSPSKPQTKDDVGDQLEVRSDNMTDMTGGVEVDTITHHSLAVVPRASTSTRSWPTKIAFMAGDDLEELEHAEGHPVGIDPAEAYSASPSTSGGVSP